MCIRYTRRMGQWGCIGYIEGDSISGTDSPTAFGSVLNETFTKFYTEDVTELTRVDPMDALSWVIGRFTARVISANTRQRTDRQMPAQRPSLGRNGEHALCHYATEIIISPSPPNPIERKGFGQWSVRCPPVRPSVGQSVSGRTIFQF